MSNGKGTASNSNESPYLHWNDEMDRLFLTALLEEDHKGFRNDGNWSTTAYCHMVDSLRSTIGPMITKNHLKHRLKTLKSHFGKVYDLFNSLSGFAWNPITMKFEATDEVWDDLIKAKPDAAKWRKTPIKNYAILRELFGNDRATGKKATTASDRLNRWDKETIDLNDCSEDDRTHEPDISMFDGQQCSSPTLTTSVHIMVLQINQQVAECQTEVAEKHVEIAEKHLTLMQQTRPRHYSEAEVWNMLEELNVPDEYRLSCYDYLCDHEQKKRKVFGVPPHMRVQALVQVMKDAGLN